MWVCVCAYTAQCRDQTVKLNSRTTWRENVFLFVVVVASKLIELFVDGIFSFSLLVISKSFLLGIGLNGRLFNFDFF